MKRIDKENYYLDIAETVLERSTCLRRCYGAIIVKNDEIVSTGYNGAPRGRKNCMDLGYCAREAMNVPSGQRYELCRSVHAEMNAIAAACRERQGWRLSDCTLYVTMEPCPMCAGAILGARIPRVVCGTKDPVMGAMGSVWSLHRHPVQGEGADVTCGCMEAACRAQLQAFFQARREAGKATAQENDNALINHLKRTKKPYTVLPD